MQYRQDHLQIKEMWDWLVEVAIPSMSYPDCDLEHKCVRFKHDRVILPSGLSLQYPLLGMGDNGQWTYMSGSKPTKIYGGLLLENIIQALARVPIGEQLVIIDDESPVTVVSTTHDEIIGVVHESEADDALEFMLETMATTPSWAPGLPLDAEGGYAKEYSK